LPGNDFGLDGKNVLILGAGQGIGESSSLLLAETGCNVATADIDFARADRVRGLVADRGRRGLALAVDVTDPDAVAEAVTRADAELDGLYGLVTVVGGGGWVPVLDMTTEQWEHDLRLNLTYFLVAAREIARSLIRRRVPGSLMCVSSIDGFNASGYHAAYGASKAALIHLVKSMSAEWGQHGIRVNSVAPGSTITPSTPDLGDLDTRPAIVPLRRRGGAAEIANAVLYLMSNLASYVTGQTIAVDGGATAIGPFAYGSNPGDHILGKR
jgi:NAD(P)-dependent dehydrogenase (short-subunit alcohol dehydrogenase family)